LQPPFKVERVAATECPQRLIYIALHNDYAEDFCPTTQLPEDRCGEIAVERLLKGGRGHFGVLEHPQMSLILQADHNTLMQLRTHRIGVSFDLQSMRYSGKRIELAAAGEIPIEDVFYVRPPGSIATGKGIPMSGPRMTSRRATRSHSRPLWTTPAYARRASQKSMPVVS